MGLLTPQDIADLAAVAQAATASNVAVAVAMQPGVSSATVTIKRAAAVIVSALPATLKPPTTEQITMDGGDIRYQGTIAPAVNIRENDLLYVVACGSNPFLVAPTVGRLITDVRQVGDPSGATAFMATFKVQT